MRKTGFMFHYQGATAIAGRPIRQVLSKVGLSRRGKEITRKTETSTPELICYEV